MTVRAFAKKSAIFSIFSSPNFLKSLKETKKQKTMTFDICVQFDNGEISDIEMIW